MRYNFIRGLATPRPDHWGGGRRKSEFVTVQRVISVIVHSF